MTWQNGARPAVPVGVAASVFLLVAEFVAACVTAALYGTAGDPTWLGLTLLFALVASLAVQLALVVIHRDIGRDRPLVLLLHLLQMGALVRCVPVRAQGIFGVFLFLLWYICAWECAASMLTITQTEMICTFVSLLGGLHDYHVNIIAAKGRVCPVFICLFTKSG